MIEVLSNASYAKLFSAQVVALVGTGLLTVALGLLTFDISASNAGLVLSIAMTIKMLAYVGVAPVITALTGHIPRKVLLVAADIVRAVIALSLPFVTEAWQIYVLVFVLQSASATFTPAFQAVIPEILPNERQYTRALSLSRLAYDLESLVSPILAAALLTVVSYHNLFIGTVIGFTCSALLVLATTFPQVSVVVQTPFLERLTRGVRVFVAVPELRGLLALNLVVATSTAMVIINTVVLVQGNLERPQSDVALLLAAYGTGSMVVAIALPRVLDRIPDRRVMLAGAVSLPSGLIMVMIVVATPISPNTWAALISLWLLLGAGASLILTPSARLLRRASTTLNRPAVFAAQFSLSHACYLITYPFAGVLGAFLGLPAAALVLALIGVVAGIVALSVWAPSPTKK